MCAVQVAELVQVNVADIFLISEKELKSTYKSYI
jgi:hypothetical protein